MVTLRSRLVAALTVAAVAAPVTGCTDQAPSPSADTPSSEPAPPPRVATATDAPDPPVAVEQPPSYDLTAEEVAKKAVSGVAGPKPLRLRTKGPGGVTYQLEIPAGAFVVPTEVSMTPLSEIGGFGDGVDAAGVRLRPSGVSLVKPATLTVRGGVADDKGAAAWQSEGLADARLAWVDPFAEELRVEVTHFSEKVVTNPKPSNWSRTISLDNIATAELETVIATLEYVIDKTAVITREGGLTLDERLTIVKTATDFLELYVDRLSQELGTLATAQSVAGLQQLERSITDMLAVERRLALIGANSQGSVALQAMLALTTKLAAALEKLCVEEHSPEVGIMVLTLARRFALLSPADESAAIQRAADNCFRIEVLVQIDSRLCDDGHCSNYRHTETKFETSVNGPPMSVPWNDGTMTLDKVTLTMSKAAEPVPPATVPRPDGALVVLRIVASEAADFINSYAGPGGADYTVAEIDPFVFTYAKGWELGGPGRTLATLVHEQTGDAGYESVIVIEIKHDPVR